MKRKKEQGRGRGQIIPRGEGKWLVRVYLGRDENDKRQYHAETVWGTFTQAQQRLTKKLGELDTKTFIAPSNQTVKEFLEAYLDGKTDIEARTRADYRKRMEADVYPFLGSMKLTDLTPLRVRDHYNRTLLGTRGLSPRTIQYTHAILHQAFEKAVGWGVLLRNPTAGVELPKLRRTEPTVLTPEQVRDFVGKRKESKDPLVSLWMLLLLTGLRPGEALALKWSDFDGEWVSIQRALSEDGEGKAVVVDDTKREASRRRIAVSKSVLDALQDHRKTQAALMLKQGAAYVRNDFIFSTRTGGFFALDNVRRSWKTALKAAGLPPYRLYDTRHTHLTHLLSAGVNAKAVADRAGQANPNVLLRTYAHTVKEVEQKSASITEDLIFAPKVASSL